jgi:precorrin-6Y C5,15-methyltransferase (decarboxylating)
VADASIWVVGVGAGGWPDLPASSRRALIEADVILGGPRQLAVLDGAVGGDRVPWPAPLVPALPELLARYADRRLVVLASGDPMFFGIGATLIRLRGADGLHVLPHPSSVSLAAARLGWALEDVAVISAVGRPLAALAAAVQPGRRLLVLVASADAAAAVARLLADRGYGRSAVTVLEQLGGPDERITADLGPHDPLAIVAVDCLLDPGRMPLPRTPGLPDDAYDTDGQITKREIRALTLAVLMPLPGQLLWDIGAGSGSIGIEWMRTHPSARAIAIEPRADRRERIAANAEQLGVPGLRIVEGTAPAALTGLPVPDAIFVGGGLTAPGLLDACTDVLQPGGRLVANAVTLESETLVVAGQARLGGTLTRIVIQRAEPIGGFTGWRPAMPVTQWVWHKP